ncbi:MAG: T9SS type A sorting domain-containing protein [Saprospiraceae bacterium]
MKNVILILILIYSNSIFGQCFPDRHSTNWFDAWVTCMPKENPNPINKEGHWILYDLKNEYQIDKIKFWNLNDPSQLNWGMKDIKIDYSVDSLIWNHAGSFQLEKATGNNSYEGMPWVDVVIPKAKYILMTGVSNYGGACMGFAEVRFSAEKIKVTTDVSYEESDQNRLDINVLPNPFKDMMRIEFKSTTKNPLNIQISDLLGKGIYTEFLAMNSAYHSVKINTRKWPSGSYILIAKQGSIIKRVSLIKI